VITVGKTLATPEQVCVVSSSRNPSWHRHW